MRGAAKHLILSTWIAIIAGAWAVAIAHFASLDEAVATYRFAVAVFSGICTDWAAAISALGTSDRHVYASSRALRRSAREHIAGAEITVITPVWAGLTRARGLARLTDVNDSVTAALGAI